MWYIDVLVCTVSEELSIVRDRSGGKDREKVEMNAGVEWFENDRIMVKSR